MEELKPVHWDKQEEGDKPTYDLGKPVMELDLSPNSTLVDLVGPSSFLLWEILGVDWEWLR
jgi:hypothetical protein